MVKAVLIICGLYAMLGLLLYAVHRAIVDDEWPRLKP